MLAAADLVAQLTEPELRRVERLLRGTPDFRRWNEEVSPAWRWDWAHLALLQQRLDDVTDGIIDRLLVMMPPRHGKSECTTVRYPAYRVADLASHRTIIGAYNATLASKFSRRARSVSVKAGAVLNPVRAAVDDWETLDGGGVRAVGVGGGATGHGADLLVVDDPIKSREEAESPAYREKAWDWIKDELYTRLEPGGAMIVIATPWHHDDPTGRILAGELGDGWVVVRMPAEAEPGDPLGRAEGAALCPDRFDEAALKRIRATLGEYSYAGLYQCRPTPRTGNMFPREKAPIVPAAPADARRLRYWDKAGTAGGGKRTAGVRMSVKDGIYYVEHCVTAQLASAERNKLMRTTADLDGPAVPGWTEQEPGSGGKESAETTVQLMAGLPYRYETVTGDKVTRADPFAAQWQSGNVRVVRGEWNKLYFDELELFPSGKFSDQTDASSGAFNKLTVGAETGLLDFYAKQARELEARKVAEKAAAGVTRG